MIGKGSLVLPQFVLHVAPIGVGFDIVRIQADCFIMINKGSLVLPQPRLDDSGGKVRIQADCFIMIARAASCRPSLCFATPPIRQG